MKTTISVSIDGDLKKRAQDRGIKISKFLTDALEKQLLEPAPADELDKTFNENKEKSDLAYQTWYKQNEEARLKAEAERKALRKAEFDQKQNALQTRFREAWDKYGRESSEALALRDELKKLAEEYRDL